MIRIFMRTCFLFIFAILLFQNGFTQNVVLKPEENISPFFTFEEWVYSGGNWGYDSYGLTSFEPFSPLFASSLEAAPLVFIDGVRHHTKWLTEDLNTMPNLPIAMVDSVVIRQFDNFNHGFFSPNGSIEIFTKSTDHLLTLNKEIINEINDPGPHISSELETVNIDAINYNESVIVSYPKLLNSKILYNRDRFSYTNRLTYDKELNYYRFSRTSSKRPDGNPRMRRNIDQEFFLFNQGIISGFSINTTMSYVNSPEQYTWYPLTGIEIPTQSTKLQASVSLKPVSKSNFQQSQITFSYVIPDSLTGTSVPKYGINEIILSHSSSFQFPVKRSNIYAHLNNTFFSWADETTGNSKNINDMNLVLGYDRYNFGNMNLIIGNYTLGFNYQKIINDRISLNLSSFKKNLHGNGYNYSLWNEGLGFARLDRNNHNVINNSEFVNTYSVAEISSVFSKKLFSFNWSVFTKHYWKFVHTDIEYRFNESGLQLDSDITYSDLSNIGFMGYSLFSRINPTNKLLFKTSLSGHLFRYGDELFIGSAKKINRIIFSQSAQYRADENAIFEVLFKYISPRDIVEFESLESNPLFTTAHVRPIYLLNATTKIWMFNRSLAMSLALRNLLNLTESYNTNGQYYNMSIHVGASLVLGKN